MIIEYWSDYVCPFCYIGKTRLEHALQELGIKDTAKIQFRSFELDPNTPLEVGFDAAGHFAFKYGISLEAAKKTIDGISGMGIESGIAGMDYAGTRSTNTLDAHRLTKYVEQQGNTRIQELLYHAFFCEHQNIGLRDVLLSVAGEAGLDPAAVNAMLETDAFINEVRMDEKEAHKKGIHMIPHFFIDRKTEISGTKSVVEIKEILTACKENS